MAATSTLPTGVGPFIFSAVWAVLAALVAATLFCSPISKPYRLPPVPVILSEIKDRQARKLRYFQSPRETLNAGYKKFGERIWGIDTSQGLKLVLPTTYLDELKSHPALSFTESISHDAMKPYTGVGGLSDDIVQLFKSKFNPTVGAYIPYLQDFFGRNISEVFQCEDHWVETTVYDKMLQLVSVVSTRAFYTEAASQDEEWLDLAQAYIATVLDYLHALKQWPQSLRPVACFWIPQRAMLMEQWRRLISHLLATLQTRLSSGSPADPPSIFDHIVDLRRDITTEELIHAQIALVVAGMHTTAAGLTQLVYDMAAHPEQARELRDEVLGASYDQWTKNSLGGLKKLDSWMKESQRMTSADLTTFQRQATKPFKLQSGMSIPRGTKLEIATAAIHFDDAVFCNASTFDPLRYYNMRKSEPMKHQYVSTGKHDLSWGYGRHACPGRFFADVEMKILLAELVRRCDIKMKDGQVRHKNFEFETNVMPDPQGTVLMRAAQENE